MCKPLDLKLLSRYKKIIFSDCELANWAIGQGGYLKLVKIIIGMNLNISNPVLITTLYPHLHSHPPSLSPSPFPSPHLPSPIPISIPIPLDNSFG